MIYIFDVEGTIMDHSKRINLLPDYDKYHENFLYDEPLEPICSLARNLWNSWDGHKVYFLTGMMGKHREKLKQWLENNYFDEDFIDDHLLMRGNNDLRTSPDFKLAYINDIKEVWPDQQIVVFDDRQDVCDKLAANGITCLKVMK